MSSVGTTTNDGGNKEAGLDHDPSTLDLAVGAPFKDGTAIDSGAVYLLHLNTVSGNLQRSFVLQSIDLYGLFGGRFFFLILTLVSSHCMHEMWSICDRFL